MPLLVQVTDQATAVYLVYQAYPFERVAGILDWVSRQIDIVLPFDTCYRGHRVQGGHDIQTAAGSVLQVRVQTWREHQFPLSLTTASGPPVDMVTHSTWESGAFRASEAMAPSLSVQVEHEAASSSGSSHREANQPHTLEPRRPWLEEEEEDTASLHQLPGGVPIHAPFGEEYLPGLDEEAHFESDWLQYTMWRQHVREVLSATQHTGLQRICEEAQAYRRARGTWQEFVLVLLPDTWYRGTPPRWSAMDVEGFLVYVRDFLAEQLPTDLPIQRSLHLTGVYPYLTPFEQGGEESLHLLVDPSPETVGAPVLLLEDHWSRTDILYWPMKLPSSLWTDDILRTLGRLEECQDEGISCTLTYDGFELPRLVTWRSRPGMKLGLQIQQMNEQDCLSTDNDDDDFFSAMHFQASGELDNRGEMRGSNGHDSDPVFDLVQRETGNPDTPQGNVVKFWLIPGTGAAIHDAVIRLDMRPQVPDWTGWVEQSWRMAPTQKAFLPVRGRITAISRERNELQVIGSSQRDAEQGLRSFLADLVYANVLRRGAIRCSILSPVVEIVRMFTSRHIPVDSPLLATFQLYWHDGTEWKVFQAFEIPTMPPGSFVHIAQRSSVCTSGLLTTAPDPWLLNMILEGEQNSSDITEHMSLMQARAMTFEDEILRGATDPLYRTVQGMRHHLPLQRHLLLRIHLWCFEETRVTTLSEARTLDLRGDVSDWTVYVGLERTSVLIPIFPKPPGVSLRLSRL